MIALALILAQDPLAKPVTFPATVDDAKSVVMALSEASGVTLAIMPALEREVVGLASPNKPLKLSMDAIAKAMDAEWSLRDGVQTLVRTNALAETRRRRDFATRLKNVKTSLAELQKSYSDKPFDEAAAQQLVKDTTGPGLGNQEILARGPTEQLFRGIVATLPAEEFAGLGIGHRLVYATEPNKVQRSFPPQTLALFERYKKDQQTLAQAFKELGPDAVHQMVLGVHENDGTFAKAMVHVYRQQTFNQGVVGVQLTLYNENGRGMASAFWQITQTGSLDSQTATRPVASPPDDIPVEPTPEARRMRAHLVQRGSGQNLVLPFPPELDDLLRHPDEHEPLAMIAKAPMTTLANKKDFVVAAALPDTLLYDLVRSPGDGRTTLARWEDDLRLHSMEKLEEDGAVIYRPRLPILGDEIFTDRPAFAKFLGTLSKEGRARLDHRVQFAQANGPGEALFALSYLRRLRCFVALHSLQELRFFGSFTPAQREKLKAGGTLAMVDLSASQREALSRQIYHSPNNFLYGPPLTPAQLTLARGMWRSWHGDPTLRLPDGLPPETLLRAKISEELTFHTMETAPRQSEFPANPQTLAQAAYYKEIGREDLPPVSDLLSEAQTTTWALSATMGDVTWGGFELSDHRFTGATRKQSDLPEAFRKEIAKHLAEYRKQNAPGTPKEKVPPP